MLQVSLSFSAASRAIASVGPRPIVTRLFTPDSTLSARLQSSAVAAASRSGRRSIAARSRSSSIHAAAIRRSTARLATKDFVAAMLVSGPAAIGSTMSQAVASGLAVSFTIAAVRAPAALAIRANSVRSSLRPDCETVSSN